MKYSVIMAIYILSINLHASTTIAIIDTGVDYQNSTLKEHIWTNSNEIPNNGIDDDLNGHIDDTFGWNFVEQNNQVFDHSKLSYFGDPLYDYHDVVVKMAEGRGTYQDWIWLFQQDSGADTAFRNKLRVFGHYSHGTMVAGAAT